jgi:hypothetical protein
MFCIFADLPYFSQFLFWFPITRSVQILMQLTTQMWFFVGFTDCFYIILRQIYKVLFYRSNLWRHFHTMYTLKTPEYCRTEVLALHKFSAWNLCFHLWRLRSTKTFFCFRMSCNKHALCLVPYHATILHWPNLLRVFVVESFLLSVRRTFVA